MIEKLAVNKLRDWPEPKDGEPRLHIKEQPAAVAMDDTKLRELFDSWFASDCSFDLSPEASEEYNIAWRESYWYVWQRCRAAMLQPGNSPAHSGLRPEQISAPPVIPDDLIAAVNRLLDSDGSRGCYSAIQCGDAHDEIERLLAAAPQLPAAVPGRWIPEAHGNYWGWWSESKTQGPVWFIKSEVQAQFQSYEITHWMPLPAAPKQENI